MCWYAINGVNTDLKKKTMGFGWLEGNIEKIKSISKDSLGRNLKIPHMGWNNLNIIKQTIQF